MIRYGLLCEKGHEFDGWFRSSDDFEIQARRGFVTCPDCASTSVRKAIMAPAVVNASARAPSGDGQPGEAEPVSGVPMPDEGRTIALAAADPRRAALMAALRELKAKIVAEADYVGENFASEARQMHLGEIEHRGIYGETSLAEARALLEEGVEIHPLPVLPDERN